MLYNHRILHSCLLSTALCSAVLIVSSPMIAHAFNPHEGQEPATRSINRPRLPSVAPLITPSPRLVFSYPSSGASTSSSTLPSAQSPSAIAGSVLPTGSVAISRPKLSFAKPGTTDEAPSADTSPSFPPVDAATEAKAKEEMAALGMTGAEPAADLKKVSVLPASPITQPNEISSAPVLAPPVVTAALPEPLHESNKADTVSINLPSSPVESSRAAPPALSDESKKIIGNIPSKIDTTKPKGGKLDISRISADIMPLVANPKVESFDSGGLSIKVQRPGLDTNFELNRAYTSLMGGQSSVAIETYKNILLSEPSNEDALFGLASTYHRLGNIENARPYYAALLKLNPEHRDGLNNFLALISEESPQEALAELERLEERNPSFSPIPAQQAVLLSKLGYADRAREKMLRAIELSPDNLTYKYNLAVMLDKSGHYSDASALYRLLIAAALNGEKLPAPTDSLQKRLNFIAAVRPSVSASGS